MTIFFNEMHYAVNKLSHFLNHGGIYDERASILAKRLTNSMPYTRSNLIYISKTLETVMLENLVTQIADLSLQNLPYFGYPEQLASIELWQINYAINDSFVEKVFNRQETNIVRYWDSFFKALVDFSFLSEVPKLEICRIYIEEGNLYIELQWSGDFSSLDYYSIPNTDKRFWAVRSRRKKSYDEINKNMYFLYLQVVAAWGEQQLVPIKVEEDTLTARVNIHWANNNPTPPKEAPMWEAGFIPVSDHIIKQFFPLYQEISLELEAVLATILANLSQHPQQSTNEQKYVEQLNHFYTELIALRGAYAEIVNSRL